MDSRKLNDWLQVIGLFGVLAGLIFVGLQLRQDRQIAIAEGVSRSVGFRQDWADVMGADAAVWVKGMAGDELSAIESVQFEALANALEVQLYSLWNREQLIGTREEAATFARAAARQFGGNPGLLKFWRNHVTDAQQRGVVNPWIDAVNAELAGIGVPMAERE